MLQMPTITLIRPPPQPAPAADYKQQVQLRNDECYQQCAKEFPNAEGSVAACERGCRLFALGEANEPNLTAGEHRDKCIKDCAVAYPVPVEQHSCESGCHHQRPKEQDESGAPVVMSVVRKFSFNSDGDEEVRRSQSAVVVHDGDQTRVIQGPAQVTVSRHGEGGDSDAMTGFPHSLAAMVQRMREKMRQMMMNLNGETEEPEQYNEEHYGPTAEPRQHHVLVSGGLQPRLSGWRRVWRCTPHYVVLAVLLLSAALLLYTGYCLVIAARRRRRRLDRDQLIQNEEMAEDLPPKYSVAVEAEEPVKSAADKEAPPAYTSIVADDIPPKPDV